MMVSVQEFLRTPLVALLELSSHDEISGHYQIDVGDNTMKENMKCILKDKLLEASVLKAESSSDSI